MLRRTIHTNTPEETRRTFYEKVHPFGFWNKAWKAPDHAEHRADYAHLATALVWQIVTFLLPMAGVLHQWTAFAVLLVIWLLAGWRLMKDWKG